MLTLQVIKDNPEFVIERLAVKGFDARPVITEILEIDAERRRLQTKCDSDANRLKQLAASIAIHMKKGEKEEAEKAKTEVAAIKGGTKGLQDRLAECQQKQTELLLAVPNIPCDAVPLGLTADDNVVEKPAARCPTSPMTHSRTGNWQRNTISSISNSV